MNKLTLNRYGRSHPITFNLDHYAENGNLYLGMITSIDGYYEPWSDLTVNLSVKCKGNCAFIDINNNGVCDVCGDPYEGLVMPPHYWS